MAVKREHHWWSQSHIIIITPMYHQALAFKGGIRIQYHSITGSYGNITYLQISRYSIYSLGAFPLSTSLWKIYYEKNYVRISRSFDTKTYSLTHFSWLLSNFLISENSPQQYSSMTFSSSSLHISLEIFLFSEMFPNIRSFHLTMGV